MNASIIRWLEKEGQIGKHLKLHHLKALVATTRSQMTCYLTFLIFCKVCSCVFYEQKQCNYFWNSFLS